MTGHVESGRDHSSRTLCIPRPCRLESRSAHLQTRRLDDASRTHQHPFLVHPPNTPTPNPAHNRNSQKQVDSQSLGSTPHRLAPSKYGSGYGFPRATSPAAMKASGMGMPTVPSADDAYTAVAVSVSPMPHGKKGVSMGGSHAGRTRG